MYKLGTYISREISIEHPSVGLASLAQLSVKLCEQYFSKNETYISPSIQNDIINVIGCDVILSDIV